MNLTRPTTRVTITAAIAGWLLIAALAGPAAAGARSDNAVYRFSDGQPVATSAATLVTTASGATLGLRTAELERGAYTIWWVIFNHPEHCTTNPAGPLVCGAGDLANAAVLGSLQYAAGHVAGGSGRANFGGAIGVGDTRGCEEGLPCNGGLTNPAGAEIHLVLRTHGAAVPGWVDYQISSFNGACNAGEPNEGQCRNLQAAGFLL